MIQTVCGPITPAELGICLTHEHLWCNTQLAPRPELFGVFGGPDLILQDRDLVRRELGHYRQAGGSSMVDVTTPGWGRDVQVLRGLSQETGVHVVATAGFYVDACLPTYVDHETPRQLADRLTNEIERGVGDTGIRCGLLKAATSRSRIEGREEKALKAVALAQQRTGVAITTHTPNARNPEMPGGNMGPEYLAFLRAEGVAPQRLIIGHVDGRPRLETLCQLARAGCFLSFDLIGSPHRLHDLTRARLISQLIGRGHEQRLLLSQDVCAVTHTHTYGGRGYVHLLQSFLPLLRAHGVTAASIRAILVDNPGRVLNRQ